MNFFRTRFAQNVLLAGTLAGGCTLEGPTKVELMNPDGGGQFSAAQICVTSNAGGAGFSAKNRAETRTVRAKTPLCFATQPDAIKVAFDALPDGEAGRTSDGGVIPPPPTVIIEAQDRQKWTAHGVYALGNGVHEGSSTTAHSDRDQIAAGEVCVITTENGEKKPALALI